MELSPEGIPPASPLTGKESSMQASVSGRRLGEVCFEAMLGRFALTSPSVLIYDILVGKDLISVDIIPSPQIIRLAACS